LATFKIRTPFASRFRTFRSVALSIFGLAEPHAMSDGALSCASCPAMVSIRTVCRHCLANAQVCPTVAVWEDHTGETMAKLLNELGHGKPAIPPSFTPCPLALADRDRREALRDQQSLTAAFFGDPLPGMSALDRRERERPH